MSLDGEGERYPGDCEGCGAPYPYCDCYRDFDADAESKEAEYTAWEIIDAQRAS